MRRMPIRGNLNRADAVARSLVRWAIGLMIALVIAQFLLHDPSLRPLLVHMDQREGVPYRTG